MMASSEAHKSEESSDPVQDYSKLIGDVVTEKMIEEEKLLEKAAIEEEKKIRELVIKEEKEKLEEQCYKGLNLLLSRSSIYAKFISEKLQRDKLKEVKKEERAEKMRSKSIDQKKRKNVLTNSPRKKRILSVIQDDQNNQNIENEIIHNDNLEESNNLPNSQPSLLTGGVMHPYQIDGYEWIKTLYENGVNGILADEMGLGKTIQTIAFIAHLVEMGVSGPFFVCGPLSTVTNWFEEIQRFTPNIPAMVYHGPKEERQEMRKKILKMVKKNGVSCCPVVITSYQIALIDAKFLSRYDWKLLVLDEAHRIKNFQCKLVTSLKLYNASNRLLLTGTPLQNDLSELWSLLNFILPEIFDDLKVFESWFDISRLTKDGDNEIIAREQEKQIVSIIHEILAPFLLRRTKVEVQLKLPPKKEVIVHAPFTKLQQEYYTAVLNKTIEEHVGSSRGKYFDVDLNLPKRAKIGQNTFSDIYKQLGESYSKNPDKIPESVKVCELDTEQKKKDVFAEIYINVRNLSMILRKICNHPYLLSFPLADSGARKIDEELIQNSGKLLVLDQMLPELKKRGHKVLIFSQFVIMLEILEDYCMYRKYSYNLLCGDMSLEDRQEEIKKFNESDDSFIFLISTKAGGLGINLTAADTAIIYDPDWNPQGDIQAQDRCHRIGQSKPVVVYRLVIPNTFDEKIFDRANAKRKLEKVIIKKGRFNSNATQSGSKILTIEEIIELLKSCESDGYFNTNSGVLTSEELNTILDRSDMIE